MNQLQAHVDAASACRRATPDLEGLTFHVKPVPPFRLDLTVGALRRRDHNATDRWDGSAYRRVLLCDERPLDVEVVQTAPSERPMLRVSVQGPSLPLGTRFVVMSALTRLLGLDRCLDDFYRAAAGNPRLDALARDFRGLKPPRFATLFETLINAFACQQVTLDLGIRLLDRLATACAPALDGPHGRASAFPRPVDLAIRTPDELRRLGFSRQKATAMIELARAVSERRVDLDQLGDLDDEAVVERLRALPGVGRWTAEYALLRGLGRSHVFPGDDVGARNNLQRWLGLLEPLDYEGVRRVSRQVGALPGPGLSPSAAAPSRVGRDSRRSNGTFGDARASREDPALLSRDRWYGSGWRAVVSIRLKRAYDRPQASDGQRILVDGVWPRGITKEALGIDAWRRDLAPSAELRKWYGHDLARWDEFEVRYVRELEQRSEALDELVEMARAGRVTLVFGARDTEHNNAVVLKRCLERRLNT